MTDPGGLTAVPDAPSLVAVVLRMIGMILLFAAAAAAWVWWQRRSRQIVRRMSIRDRLPLARGASAVLLEVDGQRLLIGVSPDGVRLLRSLGPETAVPEPEVTERPARFAELVARRVGSGR